MPPEHEDKLLTWPDWPMKLRTSSSQEEGVRRDWAVTTKAFTGRDGRVTGIDLARVEWRAGEGGRMELHELVGSAFHIKADLVLLRHGLPPPRAYRARSGALALALDPRGNIKADTADYRTSLAKVFAAGDARRGQSLVVWAIREGRQCARAVDEHLMGHSDLPR